MGNKTKIDYFSKKQNTLSNKQHQLILELSKETIELEKKMENEINEMDLGIFLLPIIHIEATSSGLIENTQTHIEDIAYDIEGINNRYSWETRNIINAYREVLTDLDNKMFFLSIETLRKLHFKMFSKELGKKFLLVNFNPNNIIKHIKPGYILSKKSEQNWIEKNDSLDRETNLKNAKLIPINPESKIDYLKDMFDFINKNTYYPNVIAFHPFFEAIHPFADGNGRIGRLLLSVLMINSGFSKLLSLNLSYVWSKNKFAYFEHLHIVATTGDLEKWNNFFIESLIEAKRKAKNQICKTLDIWKKYKLLFREDSIEFKIFKKLMKYHKVNKMHLIKDLLDKKYPKTTIYTSVKNVSKKLNIIVENGYLIFNEILFAWK